MGGALRFGLSPCVGFGCGSAWSGEDFVELLEGLFVEADLQRAQTAFQLLNGARSDDRGGDGGLVLPLSPEKTTILPTVIPHSDLRS